MTTFTFTCPSPIRYEVVELGHGAGGLLSRELVRRFKRILGPSLQSSTDAAVVALPDRGRLVMTTDGYVVTPRIFPGGTIGGVAVHGTVNDLAMQGARPLYATLSCILEAGLPFTELDHIICSLAEAAQASGIQIVTGDTKVVPKGTGDGIYITMAGVGVTTCAWGPEQLCEGDRILLSGDLGRHALTIMVARGEVEARCTLTSDSAPVWPVVNALIEAGIQIRMARDPTRGGLTSALCEIAQDADRVLRIDDAAIPIDPRVATLCGMVGYDPLQCASEGRFVAFIAEADADRALAICRSCSTSDVARGAAIIGTVCERGNAVIKTSVFGTESYLTMPTADQFPRIC